MSLPNAKIIAKRTTNHQCFLSIVSVHLFEPHMFLFKCMIFYKNRLFIKFFNCIYSVVNEDAGKPSLLNKLALLTSLQAYLENFGLGTEAENTSTVFPIIFATAGT